MSVKTYMSHDCFTLTVENCSMEMYSATFAPIPQLNFASSEVTYFVDQPVYNFNSECI